MSAELKERFRANPYALRYTATHDLQHVLTGFDTGLAGERWLAARPAGQCLTCRIGDPSFVALVERAARRPSDEVTTMRLPLRLRAFAPAFLIVSCSAPAIDAQQVVRTPRIELGGARRFEADTRLVFHNPLPVQLRLVLPRREAAAFACELDPATSTRSRTDQILLAPDAQLPCVVAPGRYRLSIFHSQDGSILEDRAWLTVR